MGIFGFFKTKQQRQTDEALGKLWDLVFPGGEVDVVRDCKRIDVLVEGKIPESELRSFVAGCKTFLKISKFDSEDKFVRSILARSRQRISEAEAYAVFAYLAGEAALYDAVSTRVAETGGGAEAAKEMVGDMPWIYAQGTDEDKIPGGYGEFGLSVSNPVPTICVAGSDLYLARLRHGGRPVEAIRMGSMSTDATPGRVDKYKVSVGGRELGGVYICPYHKRISRIAPKGFTLAE